MKTKLKRGIAILLAIVCINTTNPNVYAEISDSQEFSQVNIIDAKATVDSEISKSKIMLDDEIKDKIVLEALDKNLTKAETEKLVREKAKEKEDNIEYLVQNGASIEKIKLIKDLDIIDIVSIVSTEKLSDISVKCLTDTWAERMYFQDSTSVEEPSFARPNNIKELTSVDNSQNLFKSEDYSSELINHKVIINSVSSLGSTINSAEGTGVHYQVTSNTGYNKTSGYIKLPTCYVANATSSNPDVPYAFFGLYTDSSSSYSMGLDLGLGFQNNQWFFAMSGYALRKVKNLNTGAITWDWTTQGKTAASIWKTLPVKYSPSQLSNVYIVAKCEKFTNNEVVTVQFIDATNWSSIGSLILDTTARDSKFLTTPTQDPLVYVAQNVTSYTNTTYSNMYVNREVTLSFMKDLTRLPNTGSYLNNAIWTNVNIYNTSGYGLWGTSQTYRAEKRGRTQSFLDSVTPTITNMWYNDTVNINY